MKDQEGWRPQADPRRIHREQGPDCVCRLDKERPPIEAVQIHRTLHMFNTKRINSAVVRSMVVKFPGIFGREARYYLERFTRPASERGSFQRATLYGSKRARVRASA